jgi:ligand-binding SRPBCC domain-containing protein
MHTLERVQVLPVEPAEAFDFFADAFNLELITPPWLRFRVETPGPIVMDRGTLISYGLRLHGLPLHWLTRIVTWEPGFRFQDVQLRGPYRVWRHTHSFESHERGTKMRDRVDYALPLGPLGSVAHAVLVRPDLDRIFDFRAAAVAARLG